MKQRTKKILIGVSIGALLLGAGAFAYLKYNFGAQSTERLEEVANQFQPDPSWELEQEIINPPVRICIDTMCDQLHRRWRVVGIPTKEAIQQRILEAGWTSQLSGDCKVEGAISGSGSRICETELQVDGYNVNVSLIATPDNTTSSVVMLSVKKGF